MLYLPKPLKLLKYFGRRRYTGGDFMSLMHACGIELVLSPEVEKGYYYYCAQTHRHVIVLSSRIDRARREQVGWHEFAHFLQNFYDPKPMMAEYCKTDNRNKRERFADLFAFVCVTGVPICGRMDFLETLMTMDMSGQPGTRRKSSSYIRS